MTLLLDDSEKCGLFGKNSETQTSVYNELCKKRKVVSGIKLQWLFWFKSENTLFKRLFPSGKVLVRLGYEYAKNRFLIPVAWVNRIFDIIFKKNKVRNESLNSDVTNERIETMKKLSIID